MRGAKQNLCGMCGSALNGSPIPLYGLWFAKLLGVLGVLLLALYVLCLALS